MKLFPSFYYIVLYLYLINIAHCSDNRIKKDIKSVKNGESFGLKVYRSGSLHSLNDPLDKMWIDPFETSDNGFSNNEDDSLSLFSKPNLNYDHYRTTAKTSKDEMDDEDEGKSELSESLRKVEGEGENQMQIFDSSNKNNIKSKKPYYKYVDPYDDSFFSNYEYNNKDSIWKNIRKLIKYCVGQFSKEYGFEGFVAVLMVTAWFTTFYTTYITGSYRVPILNILLMMIFGGYGVTWLRLSKEYEAVVAEEYLKYPTGAPQCRHDLPWYLSAYYYFFAESCSDHLKKVMIPPWIKVSPLDVLSETWSMMILYPAKNIGLAYGNFISAASGSVDWYLKPFIWLIAVLGPPIIIFGFAFFSMGYSVSFSLSPLTGFSFSLNSRQANHQIREPDIKYIEEIIEDKNKSKKSKSSKNQSEQIIKRKETLSIKDNADREEQIETAKNVSNNKKENIKSEKSKEEVLMGTDELSKKTPNIEKKTDKSDKEFEKVETVTAINTEKEHPSKCKKMNRNDLCKKQEELQTDRIEAESNEEKKYVKIDTCKKIK